LKTPSIWIKFLCRAIESEPTCKLQIAESIGPLARCMINDTKRLLFKSNKHWRQGIAGFVNLISNIMENEADNCLEEQKIIEALLVQRHHEGLLRSIVQMGFWLEYRPDIVKELRSEGLQIAGIVTASTVLMDMLVNEMEGESRIRLLKTIGTTPVVIAKSMILLV